MYSNLTNFYKIIFRTTVWEMNNSDFKMFLFQFWLEGVVQVSLAFICFWLFELLNVLFDQSVVREIKEFCCKMILVVFGVFTNSVSIYILSRKELTNTFNQLLTALAVFDILYLLLAFIDCFGQCDIDLRLNKNKVEKPLVANRSVF